MLGDEHTWGTYIHLLLICPGHLSDPLSQPPSSDLTSRGKGRIMTPKLIAWGKVSSQQIH